MATEQELPRDWFLEYTGDAPGPHDTGVTFRLSQRAARPRGERSPGVADIEPRSAPLGGGCSKTLVRAVAKIRGFTASG